METSIHAGEPEEKEEVPTASLGGRSGARKHLSGPCGAQVSEFSLSGKDYSTGAGPEESPRINSAGTWYSRPCGSAAQESSWKSIRGQLAEHIAVNVHGGDRRVAVLGEARLVKARNGNIQRHAAACSEQALDAADSRQIVDGHDGGGAGGSTSRSPGPPPTRLQSASRRGGSVRAQAPNPACICGSLRDDVVGFELGPATKAMRRWPFL